MGSSLRPVEGSQSPTGGDGGWFDPARGLVSDAESLDLQRILAAEPGPPLMTVLASIDPRSLNEAGRHLVVQAWRQCAAWVAAASQPAIIAAAEPTLPAMGDPDWLSLHLALSLRISPWAADAQIGVARELTGRFTATLGALHDGEISYLHGVAITEICRDLDTETIQLIETKVLPAAVDQTVAEFRRSVRRAMLKAAPDLAAAAHLEAARQRDVVMYAGEDAMATVAATMPAADAATVMLAIDTLAHRARDQARDAKKPGGLIDVRSIGEWRADVLLGWANEVLADPSLPKRHGRPATIQIVIDIATALGLAENPCELIGYGPIPAPVAREIASDAGWQRFLVDPVDGHLLDVGKKIYRPSQRLADYLVARDRRCRFPMCTRRATHCDIDHADPHGDGGETTRENCGCLCRRHHLLKTFGGWWLQSFHDGSCRWTTPGGQIFDVPAHRFLDTG